MKKDTPTTNSSYKALYKEQLTANVRLQQDNDKALEKIRELEDKLKKATGELTAATTLCKTAESLMSDWHKKADEYKVLHAQAKKNYNDEAYMRKQDVERCERLQHRLSYAEKKIEFLLQKSPFWVRKQYNKEFPVQP